MDKSRKRFLVGCIVAALLGVPLIAAAFAGGGILFGLAGAPNGDVFVADATVGILILRDDVVKDTIALPGVTDMSPIGSGSMWAVTGAGGSPEEDTGQALWRVSKGRAELIVNLFEFEATENPVPPTDVPDSNPFDVESLGGNSALVVDAGGNDLLRINRHGNVEVGRRVSAWCGRISACTDSSGRTIPRWNSTSATETGSGCCAPTGSR